MKEYDLSQPMDKLIDLAVKKFGAVEFQTVSVGEKSLELLQIKEMQKYIDRLMDKTRAGKKVALPLWAKIWPSGLVMGVSLSKFPFSDESKVLEIGGGCSVSGLTLAARGCDVTIIDMDQDALLFSRINALKNGLGDNVSVVFSDFSEAPGKDFDCIVSSEMLFEEKPFTALADLVDDALVDGPAGEVFLAVDLKRVAKEFFSRSSERFNIMNSSATFKDQASGENKPVNLFRFKRKAS